MNKKNPFDRRVLFTLHSTEFLSVHDIQRLLYKSGGLSPLDLVFSVDGEAYRASDVASGKAPKWALSAEHDLMFHDLPFSEADFTLDDEWLSEPDFFEMPTEPKEKNVNDFLSNKTSIARAVADAERWVSLTAGGV